MQGGINPNEKQNQAKQKHVGTIYNTNKNVLFKCFKGDILRLIFRFLILFWVPTRPVHHKHIVFSVFFQRRRRDGACA